MNTINIAYASDHNLILPFAVSLLSLVENANKDSYYVVHLLTDDSLTDDDSNLISLIQKDNFELHIHEVKNEILDSMDYSYTYLNKMTLFRLLLPEILLDVDICLYIDVDTIVLGDFSSLFELDMSEYSIAGIRDSLVSDVFDYELEGFKDMDCYTNAGVLLMNLSYMREKYMVQEFMKLVPKKYWFNDQDILNLCCQDTTLRIDEKYNAFCYKDIDNPIVVHLLSMQGMRPWNYIKCRYSDMWWEYADFFKMTSNYKLCKEKAISLYNEGSLEHFLKLSSTYENVYIWGSGYYGKLLYRGLRANDVENIRGFIDNDNEKIGNKLLDMDIVAPTDMLMGEDTVVLVSVRNEKAREEIKAQLTEMGFKDKQIHLYSRRTREFYAYIDPKYLQEEKDEVFMWEYGSKLSDLV